LKQKEKKKLHKLQRQQKKIASVITTPVVEEQIRDTRRPKAREPREPRNGKDREKNGNGRGRGERKYDKEGDVEDMEQEEPTHKPAVSSIIASPEMEKRPSPKDLNMSSRLILNAVKQAVDDTNKDASKIVTESPKKEKLKREKMDEDVNVTIIVDGTKVTKKRGSWDTEENNDQDEEEEKDKKKAKQVRCQYWPNCKRGESCIYQHPKERCKHYPNCTFGNNCLYIHPTSDVSCKFGANCTRQDCTFTHPPPISTIPCKNGFACYFFNGDQCTYFHPQEACRFGDKCTKGTGCSYSHGPQCKFGSRCNRQGCTYAHLMNSSRSRTSQTPCKFGENCKNKESCNFVHPDDPDQPVDTSALSDSLPQTPPKTEEIDVKE